MSSRSHRSRVLEHPHPNWHNGERPKHEHFDTQQRERKGRSSRDETATQVERWLRVGTMALTLFSPIINNIASRIARKNESALDDEDMQTTRAYRDARIAAELKKRHAQEEAQMASEFMKHNKKRMERDHRGNEPEAEQERDFFAALRRGSREEHHPEPEGDFFAALRGRAREGGRHTLEEKMGRRGYRERGRGDFADRLRERTSDLTQSLSERGDDLGQILAERRDDLTHEWHRRSRQLKKSMQKQNRALQKQIRRRQREEGNQSFWIALGFGFGLTLLGIFAYQFFRKRQQMAQDEEMAIQFAVEEGINVQTGNKGPFQRQEFTPFTSATTDRGIMGRSNAAPPDARFVGVSNTKLYYPVATPLEELSAGEGNRGEIVYFISEQEANDRGFKPSSSQSSWIDRSF